MTGSQSALISLESADIFESFLPLSWDFNQDQKQQGVGGQPTGISCDVADLFCYGHFLWFLMAPSSVYFHTLSWYCMITVISTVCLLLNFPLCMVSNQMHESGENQGTM